MTILNRAKEFIANVAKQQGPLLPHQERTAGNYLTKIDYSILNEGSAVAEADEVKKELLAAIHQDRH